MARLADLLDHLVALADPAGGWGYYPKTPPQVEPTCLALLALAGDRQRHEEILRKAVTTLCHWQDADGAFRIRGGREEAVWPTALALLVLECFEVDVAVRSKAVQWLLHTSGRKLEDPEAYRRDFDIDPEILGWPWTEGTFSWTEPTAWACLALRRAGFGEHPRVQEGLRLLLDRTFDTGGINAGNRRVFDRPTEPVPSVSALMLLAFAGLPDHPRLAATRRYLLNVSQRDADLEHLAWIRLALQPWRHDPVVADHLPTLEGHLAECYEERSRRRLFGPSVVREALTALALHAENAERLFAVPASPVQPPADPPPHRAGRSWTDRLISGLRGLGIKALAQLRALPAQTAVHIASVADYDGDLVAILERQFACFRDQVPLAGKRVVLKPNLVEYHQDRVINTDPRLIGAVIEMCQREKAAEVIVAEGPGHWRNTEYLVEASGLGDILRKHGVSFVDLNHDEPVAVPNLGRLTGLEFLHLARTVVDADVLISLPKLKTHHWAGVTLSLKNLFGIVPGICYGWPKNELHWRGIENSIVDIALTRTPELAIVDGILAMEGDGPLNGTPVPLGVIVMGTDLVAVDATCCRLMELIPERVGHLALAYRQRLGILPEERIVQLGEAIRDLSRPFETLPRFSHLHADGRQAAMGNV
ncbi:MAG: DUF362 domain-containing protein [Gemmatales bacterium]|nr:DUF362 domain-containing protein [Gemmatales bacterium]MDW8386147.1 DUF362 domain-containing protein [Gemmatales bacterium]